MTFHRKFWPWACDFTWLGKKEKLDFARAFEARPRAKTNRLTEGRLVCIYTP